MNTTEIKQAVIDENLTEEQLRAIDADAIRQRFPDERMTGTFIKKVLLHLQLHLEKMEDDLNSKEVVKAIAMFAKNNPDAEHRMYRDRGRKYVLIALDGFEPEVE